MLFPSHQLLLCLCEPMNLKFPGPLSVLSFFFMCLPFSCLELFFFFSLIFRILCIFRSLSFLAILFSLNSGASIPTREVGCGLTTHCWVQPTTILTLASNGTWVKRHTSSVSSPHVKRVRIPWC